MKHIFYFIAIAPIFWEVLCLRNITQISNFCKKLEETKVDDRSTSQNILSYLMLLYLSWAFVGIFSSQWVLFLFIIAISLIPKKNKWVRWVDSLITFLILVFILLNEYHLKIDLLSLIIDKTK